MHVAQTVAREAGELVRAGREGEVSVAGTKSSAQDVVTAMDLASEALLRRRLAELRPDDGLLGEEGSLTPGSSGVWWVVDPIDGTVNYLYGLPAYAVSVAAVRSPVGTSPDPATWTVLAGCVLAPKDGRVFLAGLGQGATLDGRTLQVNEPQPLIGCLVGTGFGYVAARRRNQARVVAGLLPQVRDIRRIGSAALDLCTLASGGLDLYYERGLQPWDLAAGSLVAQEAGAVVTGLRGHRAGEAMTVAGPPGRVEELVAYLEASDADQDS
ncbi:inositol monophosphatase family protein [Cellulomonas sp. McL0617]|uniref:inositol monophosphatase family protein n=1 Tax=Cellulomonas sp. McL0617 TaxID=3415675 RepID=UPI003CF5D8EA